VLACQYRLIEVVDANGVVVDALCDKRYLLY
jgi:hypothetical protein